MAQMIKQPNIFGRLGTGIGQGLAEQVPKEIERSRLASGLEKLGKESGDLSPIENLTRLAAIPGALDRPQLIQSFSELARQQGKANSIRQHANEQKKEISDVYNQVAPRNQEKVNLSRGSAASLTTPELFETVKQGFTPRGNEQIIGDAANNYPALFQADPEKAISLEKESEAIREKQYLENEKKYNRIVNIQDNTVDRLRNLSNKLTGNQSIPANIYNEIENKALNALKPKSEGGEGLDETTAVKKYGDEIEKISRQYANARGLGGLSILGRSPKETLGTLKSIQKDFEERGDTRNLADTLISDSDLSPMFAYSIAEPVYKNKDLNKELSSLKNLKTIIPGLPGAYDVSNVDNETLNVSKKLAPIIGKGNGSPLAVAYELQKKGYNPRVWLDYLDSQINNPEIGLTALQADQLGKTGSYTGTLNDWWLSSWSGIE